MSNIKIPVLDGHLAVREYGGLLPGRNSSLLALKILLGEALEVRMFTNITYEVN